MEAAEERGPEAVSHVDACCFKVLSVDGGGYLGLATAKFIADSEKHFGSRYSERFQLFCGTSTGAIIALALAFGKTGEEIVDLYRQLGPRVFPHTWGLARWFHKRKSLVVAKYSARALRELLDDAFGNTTLGDLRNAGKLVLITAFSVTNGRPRVFKTDHSKNLSRDDNLKLADIAMASSAAPTFFPVVPIVRGDTKFEELFCDGGVVANHPALLGLAEALGELEVPASELCVLSLSTPRTDLGKRKLWVWRRGLWQWKDSLASILIDGNSAITHEAIKRIIRGYPEPRPRYVRIDLQNMDGLEMDLASAYAAGALENIGSQKAASNDVRPLIEPFLR